MKEYTVVTSLTLELLIEEVNMLIKKGWRPQGGVSDYRGYHQAMVR